MFFLLFCTLHANPLLVIIERKEKVKLLHLAPLKRVRWSMTRNFLLFSLFLYSDISPLCISPMCRRGLFVGVKLSSSFHGSAWIFAGQCNRHFGLAVHTNNHSLIYIHFGGYLNIASFTCNIVSFTLFDSTFKCIYDTG